MLKLNLEIQDPRAADAPQLLALAALFTALASGNKLDQSRASAHAAIYGAGDQVAKQATATPPVGGTLAPEDNPERGMPSPAEAFGTTMGNAGAASGSASFQSNASTGADSTSASPESENGGHSAPAASLLDPAIAFGGNSAPNAPPAAAPSTPPAGTPPAQNSGAQTAGASIPASGAVELDAEGLPWDATINAMSADGGHPKTTDGKWKKKRGVGETYLNERKAALRAALAAGNGAVPAGAPATPPANVPVPPPAGAGAPVPPPPPATTPAPGSVGNVTPTPQASPQITPGADASSVTMAQLLPRVTSAMTSGLLTVDSAAALAKEVSGGAIDNVAMFAVRPDLVPVLWQRLDVLGIPQ